MDMGKVVGNPTQHPMEVAYFSNLRDSMKESMVADVRGTLWTAYRKRWMQETPPNQRLLWFQYKQRELIAEPIDITRERELEGVFQSWLIGRPVGSFQPKRQQLRDFKKEWLEIGIHLHRTSGSLEIESLDQCLMEAERCLEGENFWVKTSGIQQLRYGRHLEWLIDS